MIHRLRLLGHLPVKSQKGNVDYRYVTGLQLQAWKVTWPTIYHTCLMRTLLPATVNWLVVYKPIWHWIIQHQRRIAEEDFYRHWEWKLTSSMFSFVSISNRIYLSSTWLENDQKKSDTDEHMASFLSPSAFNCTSKLYPTCLPRRANFLQSARLTYRPQSSLGVY